MAGCVVDSGMKNEISEQKIDETLTGTLVSQDGLVLLQHDGGSTLLESYSIDFDKYQNNLVTVVGQYSGDTLYVDKIMLAEEK